MKTEMKKRLRETFSSTSSRYGSFSLGAVALVVALVIVANLIVGQLPEVVRSVDLSDNKIYEITEASRELIKKLDQPVSITVLAEKDQVDKRIRNFVEKYAGLSSDISLEWIDSVQHPSALSKYDAQADSLVVSCEETEKQRVISFGEIITYDQMSYYTTGSMQETAFDGEGQLTAAVNYVTSSESKKIYYSTGHGESEFSSSVQGLMEKANYTMEEWNLLMDPQIPEDCELFIMNGAVSDVTEDEQKGILDHLQKGGKVMIFLGESEKRVTPNLDAVLKEYGLERETGYIADMQRSYQQNPYYIFPELSLGEEYAKGMSSEMVMLINAQGFTQTEPARENIELDAFMNTSEDGYAVTEDDEKQGSYVLGAVATESISVNSVSENQTEDEEGAGDGESTETGGAAQDDGLQSRLTVLGAASMINPNLTDTFSTLENLTLFMNLVGANFGEDTSITIEPKSLEVTYNTVQYPGLFSLLVIFGIPVIVLGSGFVTWMRRRKA